VGNPPQLFPSVYEGTAQLQFRQPLLAGGGTEYTRIAGPVSSNIQGVTGVQQGVLIARINDDMALAEFERSVHQMIHDVETLYWQLHLAYRSYAVQIEAREAALEAWRRVDSQIRGLTGPGGAQEAEFRDNFLSISGQAETARDSIYAAEAQLRLLMGLPVNDGRVIRPSDSPVTAEFIPDWTLSLSDAFANRPEIRRQKWSIRSLDLQRRAAMNLTQPRLDFVSGYQINGFGDDLYNIGNGSAGRYPGAVENLLSNKETGWNLGFEFSVPIGRRFAFAQVRTLELRLAKAQEMLSQQEVEISHEVAAVFRDIDRNYVSLQNAYNRLLAARDRMRLAQAQYHNDPTQYTIDTIVRAQQALAQAELSFATSLVQYNTALADLQYRTGRTLLSNNIHLMEGPWVDEATTDALHQFDAREHGVDADWIKHPQPEPLSTPGVTTGAVFLPASVEPRTSEPEPVPATPLPAPPAPDDLIFPPAPLERASFEP
jgi:outer membrane protein TolC